MKLSELQRRAATGIEVMARNLGGGARCPLCHTKIPLVMVESPRNQVYVGYGPHPGNHPQSVRCYQSLHPAEPRLNLSDVNPTCVQ